MRTRLLLVAALGILASACFDTETTSAPGVDASLPFDSGHDAAVFDSAAVDSSIDATTDADATTPADAATDAGSDAPALTYPQVVRADTPLSYWRFGEASGTVATDEIGVTNGAYTGGVTLGAVGAIAGDANTAATFDGATGYVALGTGFAFAGNSAMTFELWVSPGTLDASNRRFFSKEANVGGRQGYLIASVANGDAGLMSFERWRDGANDAVLTTIPYGKYTHLVVTYDGATMAMYANGVSVGTTPSTRMLTSLNVAMNLATYTDPSFGPAEFFPGSIDELAIYDHALTPQRVLLHYQVGSGM